MAAKSEQQETAALDLGALLDAGDGAVVILTVGKTCLVAHRAVLAAGSPVFAAMFYHDTLEASRGEVIITDVAGPVLRQLVAYLYTGRAPQLRSMTLQLLAAADKYAVSALKDACEQQMVEQLALENAAAAAVMAVRHSCQSLRKAAIAFIKDHMYEVTATQGWADMVHHHPTHFVEVSRLLSEPPAETSAPEAADISAGPTVTTSVPDDALISRLWSLPAEERDTRLVQAAKQGVVLEVKALLAAGADVEAEDREGYTALHQAAREGHLEAVQCLLQAGAEVEATDRVWQQTPLHFAAANGRTAVVRLLLAASANVGTRNRNRCTPLHCAAQYGRAEAVAVLLEAGSHRGARDNRALTALDWARERNHLPVIQALQ